MVFDELLVLHDIAVKDLGGCARLAVGLTEAALLAPSLIGRLLADGVLRHLEGVPHRDTIGQEVTEGTLGHIAQGVIGRAIVEARIVRDDGLDIVLLAQVGHMAAGGEDGNDAARAVGDVGLIYGALGGIVRGVEQGAVSAKDVVDDEGEGLIDATALVVDSSAEVVHHRVVEAVGGFRVDGQVIRLALVGHGKNLISQCQSVRRPSLDCTLIVSHNGIVVNKGIRLQQSN